MISGMATTPEWTALGRRVRARRDSKGYSTRQAVGSNHATLRRVEAGTRVEAASLYMVCQGVGFSEDEARELFGSVGLDFDGADYRQPEPLRLLRDALNSITAAMETAEMALVRVEDEMRGKR